VCVPIMSLENTVCIPPCTLLCILILQAAMAKFDTVRVASDIKSSFLAITGSMKIHLQQRRRGTPTTSCFCLILPV